MIAETAEQKFNRIHEVYRQKIYAHTMGIVGNRQQAEDVVQETFLKCWKHINELNPGEEGAWLYRTATTTAIDELRKNAKYTKCLPLEFAANQLIANDPLDHIDIGQRLNALILHIRNLSEKQQRILALVGQGYAYLEIADILGLAPDTIKLYVHRARKKLAPHKAALLAS